MKFRTKNAAFSLVELLTVVAIMSIMMGVIVSSGMGTRPAGSRQGAVSQLIGSLEEARMSAVERGVPVYFAVAGSDAPEQEKRLRSYLLFREQTPDEKASSGSTNNISNGGPAVVLTRWESLPQGFYFDPALLETVTTEVDVQSGLPSGITKVRAMKFGSLGQLQGTVTTNAPSLSVVSGALDPASGTITPVGKSDFCVEISRLTGRVRFDDTESANP